jgi:hypothetical protein
MTCSFQILRSRFCTLHNQAWLLLLTVAWFVGQHAPDANAVEIALTRVGTPIWRPADFQLFTAPAEPFPEAFFDVIDQLLPLEGPGAPSYTPHAPPYETELSTNAAAAGIVSQSVFTREAITLSPNGVYLAFMFLPDPGVTGSSRDFASGPVIPNSVFPLSSNVDVLRNGILVDRLLGSDGSVPVRGADASYTGASHRSAVQVVWHPWDDDLSAPAEGNYELRWTLRDTANNGWDISAPFRVVPEPTAGGLAFAAALSGLAIRRRKRTPC